MTKEIVIRCNHCTTKIEPENGFGFKFYDNKGARAVAMRDAENHLCLDCGKGYYEALKSVLAPASSAGSQHD